MTSDSRAAEEVNRIGHEHSDVTGGWLRPAVFGASDGLVSNFALIAGVAGGTDDSKTVLLAGLAGLAAGAFSMAAGEYISVRSQAEQALAEIELERREIARNPRGEEFELAQMYVAKGLEPDLAREVARQLSKDPDAVAGRARPRGARARPGRPALGHPGGRLVVPVLRRRGVPAGAALPVRRDLDAAGPGAHRGRALPVRRLRHQAHAAPVVVRRLAPGRRRVRWPPR